MKMSPEAAVAFGLNMAAQKVLAPEAYQDVTFDLMDKMTLLFTNVQGPSKAVSFCGVGVRNLYFYVPALVGTCFGVVSYNNKVCLGIVGDDQLVTDPDLLAEGFITELEELDQATAGAAPGDLQPSCVSARHVAQLLVLCVLIAVVLGLVDRSEHFWCPVRGAWLCG